LLSTALVASLLWLYFVPYAASQRSLSRAERQAPADRSAAARLAAQQGKPCDLIFIGASNVEFWATGGETVWERYYAPRHALNYGVAGDTTHLCLRRLDNPGLLTLHPKVAVLFIGLNSRGDTPQQTAEGICAVAAKTKVIFPGVHVIVVSLTPNGRNDAEVVQTNRIVQAAAGEKDFAYLDLYSHLPRLGNNWLGLRGDSLHLNPHGYEIWAGQMEPLLQRLLPLDPPAASSLAAKR
jgi:lysophospholipase L1-like esterase